MQREALKGFRMVVTAEEGLYFMKPQYIEGVYRG